MGKTVTNWEEVRQAVASMLGTTELGVGFWNQLYQPWLNLVRDLDVFLDLAYTLKNPGQERNTPQRAQAEATTMKNPRSLLTQLELF